MARPASRKRTIDTAVLLIGGGPVGAVLAAAFDGAGVPTVVVDVRDPRIAPPDTFDGRAYAIALGSRRVLEGVGLWDALPEAPAPIDHIRVSDGESPLHLHYDHQALAGAPFGFMVEARFLGRAIAERLAGLGRVDVLAPARLEALERGEHGVTATLEDGRRIRARLAVGADGRNSWTRRSAGLRVSGWSYDQTAIVCTIGHKRDHGCVAHERFLPSGPFAILPLSGRHCSIVWTERAERAPAFLALDDEAFLAAVAERFGDFLGALRLVGPRWSYPLGLQFAERPVARRLALIGDAAHVIHPLAGQGLNMGIRDAAAPGGSGGRCPPARPGYRVNGGGQPFRPLAAVRQRLDGGLHRRHQSAVLQRPGASAGRPPGGHGRRRPDADVEAAPGPAGHGASR